MPRAGSGPRMDEVPVGPRQQVASGLIRYKHGLRDGIKRRWSTGRGAWAGDGMRRTGTGGGKAIRTEQGGTGGSKRHAIAPWD